MCKFIENFKENLKVKKDNSESYRFKFENNYDCSVIRKEGLWELAVVKHDENGYCPVSRDTKTNRDVLGYVFRYLSEDEVCKYLEQIRNL